MEEESVLRYRELVSQEGTRSTEKPAFSIRLVKPVGYKGSDRKSGTQEPINTVDSAHQTLVASQHAGAAIYRRIFFTETPNTATLRCCFSSP
jgi:hypothetical protein